jgi:hypothetical protein
LDVGGVTGGFTLGGTTAQSLGGNGSIVGAVSTGAAGSKISPGTSFGKLTFSGNSSNITLDTNATVEMEIGGDGSGVGTAGIHYDQILISGSSKTFTPGSATLKLVAMPGIVSGQAYTIVATSGGAVVATAENPLSYFKTLGGTLMDNEATTYSQGNLSFTIDYSSSAISVTFSAVPEPSTLGLAMLAAPVLLRRRRRV